MASFADIKETRLTISDPSGFIDFLEVANFAALPVTPVAQTAYKAVDTATYYGKESGAWEALKLRVSDSRISDWIDALGVDGAILKSIQAILSTLPGEMMIVKNTDGAESTEFTKLLDLQKFYQNWLKDLAPVNAASSTGRYFKTKAPCIAGGNL